MIYKGREATITFDPEVPCVVWTPEAFPKGDKFRDPFKKGMDFLEKISKTNKDTQWLNDTRKLKMVILNDIRWLNKNVNDRAYEIGTKRVAFILPKNIYGRIAVKFYVDFTQKRKDNKLDIKAFSSIDEAKRWLKEGTGKGISII